MADSWLQQIACLLNCKVGKLPFSYLGLPIGVNPIKLSTWHPVVEKVKKKRLLSWDSKHISLGGRVVLLKSILYSLMIYFLYFFKAPRGILSLLESLFKNFLGGGARVKREFFGWLGIKFVWGVGRVVWV